MNCFVRICVAATVFFCISPVLSKAISNSARLPEKIQPSEPSQESLSVVEKTFNLGAELKIGQKLLVKSFAIIKNGQKPDSETAWYGVFQYEDELFFYFGQPGKPMIFPINSILTASAKTIVEFDLSGEQPQPKLVEKGKTPTHPLTMSLSLTEEVKLFKKFIVLLGNGQKKDIHTFVEKLGSTAVEEMAFDAMVTYMSCQHSFVPTPDDPEKLEDILQNKQKLTTPIRLTGTNAFLSGRQVLALAQELAALEESQAEQENA